MAQAPYDAAVGHVFISYSRADKAYVEKLAAHLVSAGVIAVAAGGAHSLAIVVD